MLSGSAAIVFWAMFVQVLDLDLDLADPKAALKDPSWAEILWTSLLCVAASGAVVVVLRLSLNGFLRWMARTFPGLTVPLGDRSPWIIAMDRVGRPNTVKVVMKSGVIYIGSVDVAPQNEEDDSIVVKLGSTAMVRPEYPHRNTDPISFGEGTPVLAVLQKADIAALEIFDHATEDKMAAKEESEPVTQQDVEECRANLAELGT